MSNGRWERQLVVSLTECGIPALRCPSSGSGTDRELPDVLAGESRFLSRTVRGLKTTTVSVAYALEVKTTSDTTAYVGPEEVEALESFAAKFGATPLLAGRFKREGQRTPFWCVPPSQARMTDGGNYGIPEADAEERASMVVWPSTRNCDPEVEHVPQE